MPAMVRRLNDVLTPIITTTFNNCVTQGRYPTHLTITRIAAIYKNKGHPSDPQFYRPISILPIIAKIFDTIINDQLMSHLLTHNILSKYNYAFRQQSDTTLALHTILDHLLQSTSKQQPTIAIFIDLTKAYDTISHTKLLDKLQHSYNFDPTTLALFTSYFTNRRQSTHTPYAHSSFQTITTGIPQGSTLSTTLFLLYINDIHLSTTHGQDYLYADDITYIATSTTVDLLQQHTQKDIDSLLHYLASNHLVPSPDKTTFTTFYPKTTQPIHPILNTPIKHHDTTQLLGIRLQRNYKHNEHATKIISKLRRTAYLLRQVNEDSDRVVV
eukprot:Lithocolla_globosa_v1_NODE_5025_length_1317_cov_8.157686.p1 type:complete len:327 gc:universal NODE_5025_length_1317_cov_8.157686:268-1248(+)